MGGNCGRDLRNWRRGRWRDPSVLLADLKGAENRFSVAARFAAASHPSFRSEPPTFP